VCVLDLPAVKFGKSVPTTRFGCYCFSLNFQIEYDVFLIYIPFQTFIRRVRENVYFFLYIRTIIIIISLKLSIGSIKKMRKIYRILCNYINIIMCVVVS